MQPLTLEQEQYIRIIIRAEVDSQLKARERANSQRLVRIENQLKDNSAEIKNNSVEIKNNSAELKVLANELKNQREMIQLQMEYMEKRFSTMQWIMGIGFTAIVTLMAIFKYIS